MTLDVSPKPELLLRLFAGPELLRREERVRLSPFEGALLGLVYGSANGELRRPELLGLLWPGDPEQRARRRLNQLLYSVRRRVGHVSLLQTVGDRLSRADDTVRCDLADFHSALETGALLEGARMLELGFLSRLTEDVVPEVSMWAMARSGELRRELRRKAQRQWLEAKTGSDWGRARVAAEALLALDPTDETFLQQVMEARARTGSPGEAELALEEFADRWSADRWDEGSPTDWEPREETLSLLRELHSLPAYGESVPADMLPEAPPPPLLGRDEERAALVEALSREATTDMRAVLLTGEAGIGKTRLIREALLALPLRGPKVYAAGAAELEQLIPLNPLIEALKEEDVCKVLADLEEPWRAVLYGVMPHHYLGEPPIPEAPHIQPGSVPRRLFEAFFQLLASLTEVRPLVLVLEDLQWADETTLSVLEFLLRRWDRGGFHLVCSLRTEELRRNPTLGRFLEALRAHSDFLEISLEDLAPQVTDRLIQSLAPEPLDPRVVSRLRTFAGGNPFFIIELTLEFLAGRLDPRIPPGETLLIPLSIRQVLERRLSQLSPEAELVLAALAVYSKPIDLGGLCKISSSSDSQCLSALDQLHQFRLVSSRAGRISISHELIRHTVYQALNDSRKTWLHGAVAQYLTATRESPPPDELALHFHRAANSTEARKYASEAADHAESAGATPEALRFLRIAREHTDDPKQAASLLSRMGHLNYLHQNLEEATPLLELAAQRLRRLGAPEEALRPEIERIDALAQLGAIMHQDCLEELARIREEAAARGDWEIFHKVLDVQAHQLDRRGDLPALRCLLGEARSFSERGGPVARCKALTTLALNIYFGSPDEGLEAAREAVAIARSTSEKELLLQALNRLIVVLHYQGLLNSPEGTESLAEAERLLATSGDLIQKFFFMINRSVWLLETGRLGAARTSFSRAAEFIQGSKAKHPRAILYLNLAELHLEDHEPELAQEAYLTAASFFSASSPVFFNTIATAGIGLSALELGDLRTAREKEAELPCLPDFWTFDPTIVITFKAKMLTRRQDEAGAMRLLSTTRERVRERMLPTWLRLSQLQARILRRTDKERARAIAGEALALAEDLSLDERVQQLRGFLGHLGRG